MCFEGVRVIEGRMRALKRPHTDWQKGRVPYQGLLFSLMKTKSGVKLFFNIKKNTPRWPCYPNLPPSRESI